LRANRSGGYVFIVLLDEEREARLLADLLGDLPAVHEDSSSVFVAPVRGLGFFADGSKQAGLDEWWSSSVRGKAQPVFLVQDHEELPDWIEGLDGFFCVGVADTERLALYTAYPTALAHIGVGPLDYVRAVLGLLEVPSATYEIVSEVAEPASHPYNGNETPALAPFELLASVSAGSSMTQLPDTRPVIVSSPARQPVTHRLPGWLRRDSTRRAASGGTDRELAGALTTRGTTIVAVGSRKGGVGKTSDAAGMAIVAGSVLDQVGHRAAIVDANVANPDAWGQLNLPRGVATVRDVVAALTSNREPPRPVYASTTALACYPENRETSEYSRTDIIRLARYLRGLYTFIVVDMSNRLPDPTVGPDAAAAAYWLEQADCLILPTASSKQDFNGVLDYLELPELPPTVVAYITPVSRRNREHPLIKRYLAAIGQRAHRVVNLPDEADRIRYAGMEGIPVQDVSPRLRSAYRALVEAVASAPPPGR